MKSHTARSSRYALCAAQLCGACALLPNLAAAHSADDDWGFRASIYGFFPDIGGSTRFPAPGGGDIDIEADDLVRNTEFAFMGSFEAQKGRWGAFTDFIYMDVGDSVSDASSLAQGSAPLPPGLTADAALDIEAEVWTLAVNYRAFSSPEATADVFTGARLLSAKSELKWEFNADFGPFSGPARSGAVEAERDSWDGVVGVKGQLRFGSHDQWFIPYYADVGAGDSDLTWQAVTGFGYATRSVEIFATWRYLDYDFGPDAKIADLDFSGPAVGAAFRW
jgi:hypothetical protein